MVKRSINELITEFTKTQDSLCQKVIGEYCLQDDVSVVFSVPKIGVIDLNGERWTFKRHGSGIRFTSSDRGHVIDAHRTVVSYPAGFDAWRLLQFLETIDTANLELAQETGGLEDETKINELLSSLSAQGVIAPVEHSAGLYVKSPV